MEAHEINSPISQKPIGRDERAQKTTQFLLRRVRAVGQTNIAEYAGTSESLVSRWFSENVETLSRALAYMDVKIVPCEMRCVKDEKTLDNLLHWAKIGMDSVKSADDLLFEDFE